LRLTLVSFGCFRSILHILLGIVAEILPHTRFKIA
jgi:hypothetical protein